MNEISTPYYPYRTQKVAIWLCAIYLPVYICMLCLSIYYFDYRFFILSIICIILIISVLTMIIPLLKTHIACDSNCIHIYEKNVQHSIPWDSISYKYRSHNYKGHEYLILSRCVLQKSDIKKAIRYWKIKEQICFENYYVIYLDWVHPQLVKDFLQCIEANITSNSNEV